MAKLPPEINSVAKKAGVRKVARRTDMSEAFARGEFNADTVDAYLNRRKSDRPHWFKNRAPEEKPFKKEGNPWSVEGWNVSRQGQVVKALGLEKATGIAKSAGSFIGATKPAIRKSAA